MTKSELIKWFMTSYPNLVKDMERSDHNFDKDNLNPYHLEGSVWTHTCMVVNQCKDFNTMFVTLLHDIGKPMCREVVADKKRVRFFSHEVVSAFLSLDVMKKFEEDFNVKLPKKDMFLTIAMHTEPFKIPEKINERLVNQERSLIDLLKSCSDADAEGRFHEDYKNEVWVPEYITKDIERKTKTVTVLIGLPCSGKTSYIRSLDPSTMSCVISRDDILEKFPGNTYNEKWANANHKEVDRILNDWKKRCIKSGDDLIFDLTHMSRKSRRKSIANLPKEYKKKAVVFLPTLTEIIKRSEIREKEGKSVSESGYIQMIKAFYPPMYDEFDEIEWRFE